MFKEQKKTPMAGVWPTKGKLIEDKNRETGKK